MHTTYAYGNRGSLLSILRTLQMSKDQIDCKPILDAIRFINEYWNESDLAYYISIRDPDMWGEATTTVACDSTHLFAWDQNLMSAWHFRYRKK